MRRPQRAAELRPNAGAAKGDNYVWNGSLFVPRTVGPAGTFLMADGQDATGLNWFKDPTRFDLPTGSLACTIPYRGMWAAANLSLLSTQRLSLAALWLPSNLLITSITFLSGATALGTGNHQLFGLYDSSLNLLRGTSDDTNVAWGSSVTKTLNLTSTYRTLTAGLFYLGILIDATTVPTLRGITGDSTAIKATAPVLYGTSSTGQTSLPNPAGAMTAAAGVPFAYVS